jgi:hypothetical protein
MGGLLISATGFVHGTATGLLIAMSLGLLNGQPTGLQTE